MAEWLLFVPSVDNVRHRRFDRAALRRHWDIRRRLRPGRRRHAPCTLPRALTFSASLAHGVP